MMIHGVTSKSRKFVIVVIVYKDPGEDINIQEATQFVSKQL